MQCECVHAKSLQSCPTLFNPIDCSPPGSSVQGILQARILEWIAMPSSRASVRLIPQSTPHSPRELRVQLSLLTSSHHQ